MSSAHIENTPTGASLQLSMPKVRAGRPSAMLLGLALLLCSYPIATRAQDLDVDLDVDLDAEVGADQEAEREEDDEEADEGDESSDDDLLFDDAEAPEAEGPLSAFLNVGLGLTGRVITLGTQTGPLRLDTSLVPAASVGLMTRVALGAAFVDFDIRYQTSLWTAGAQGAPNSIGHAIPLRTHRAAAAVGPGLRLGDDDDSFRAAILFGYGLRSLASVDALAIPRNTLHGPLLRLDLSLPIAGVVVLFIRPEAHMLLGVDRALRDTGNLDGRGFAWGGEGGLAVHVLDWFDVTASYRESHASVGSAWTRGLTDVERYLTLDASMRYY